MLQKFKRRGQAFWERAVGFIRKYTHRCFRKKLDPFKKLSQDLKELNSSIFKAFAISKKRMSAAGAALSGAASKGISINQAAASMQKFGEQLNKVFKPKPDGYLKIHGKIYAFAFIKSMYPLAENTCPVCVKLKINFVVFSTEPKQWSIFNGDSMCTDCAAIRAADNKSKLKLLYKEKV